MNQGKRLLFYIVLNILVSACTTLAVLWFWNRPHQTLASLFSQVPENSTSFTPAQNQAAAPTSASQASTAQSTTVFQPTVPASSPAANSGQKVIVIDNVFGVGNLKDEYVLLKRAGDGELDLTNWKLDDGNGNTYKFPALTLYKDGAVQVHTAAGVNSVVDLYWGKPESVWQEGKIVTLTDDKGSVRATYRIP